MPQSQREVSDLSEGHQHRAQEVPTPVLPAEPLLGRAVKIGNARSAESWTTQHPAQPSDNEEQPCTNQGNIRTASWVEDPQHAEGEYAEAQQADAEDER